jgi:hypothetical integral membrane protein (TIGR02206 family)
MNSEPAVQAFGAAHLTIICMTIALPFLLAAIARRIRSKWFERIVAIGLSLILVVNYFAYLIFIRKFGVVLWHQMLPLQLCDWGLVVVIVAMLTGRERWFEVAYFWGLGGTLQAVLTPNLSYGFPDFRFLSFFISHCGIIIGVVFLMLVHRYRPRPFSIVRVFAWTELYFVITMMVDAITGVNYGFLLHKPEAFSILNFLSDWRPLYLLEMHGVALLFFVVLYLPFAIVDLVSGKQVIPSDARNLANSSGDSES